MEKGKKKRKGEREKEREMAKIAAVIATGGRAWATGSARDGTAARKKREWYGQRKKEKKRWNDDWDGENF